MKKSPTFKAGLPLLHGSLQNVRSNGSNKSYKMTHSSSKLILILPWQRKQYRYLSTFIEDSVIFCKRKWHNAQNRQNVNFLLGVVQNSLHMMSANLLWQGIWLREGLPATGRSIISFIGLRFGSKNTSKMSIFLEYISRNSVFLFEPKWIPNSKQYRQFYSGIYRKFCLFENWS